MESDLGAPMGSDDSGQYTGLAGNEFLDIQGRIRWEHVSIRGVFVTEFSNAQRIGHGCIYPLEDVAKIRRVHPGVECLPLCPDAVDIRMMSPKNGIVSGRQVTEHVAATGQITLSPRRKDRLPADPDMHGIVRFHIEDTKGLINVHSSAEIPPCLDSENAINVIRGWIVMMKIDREAISEFTGKAHLGKKRVRGLQCINEGCAVSGVDAASRFVKPRGSSSNRCPREGGVLKWYRWLHSRRGWRAGRHSRRNDMPSGCNCRPPVE